MAQKLVPPRRWGSLAIGSERCHWRPCDGSGLRAFTYFATVAEDVSKIAIIGAGHVGVTHAAGFAELGHSVAAVDINKQRVAALRRGEVWFHEPGLQELLTRGLRNRRVTITSSFVTALRNAEFVVVCVPTPSTPDGTLDDSALRAAFEAVRRHSKSPPPIVVNKSTVPVGTGDAAAEILEQSGIRVVSNPEFLSEGKAIDDFFHPTRIVIGARDHEAGSRVAALYERLEAPVIITDPVTAELAKLAANSFLATKISFANALARVADHLGADVEELTRTLSLDPRIGPGHLRAGLGFGGSCLPKDVLAMEHLARRSSAPYELFAAVTAINREQRTLVIDHLMVRLDGVRGKRIAVLGASFKGGTDDLRESPALAVISELAAGGADVRIYDPSVRVQLEGVLVSPSAMSAVRGADAVVVATDWPEFSKLDLGRLRAAMRGRVLVDGRGLYDAARAREVGLDYYGFGRGGRQRPEPGTGA